MFYYSLYFFDIEIDYLNLFLKLEQMKKRNIFKIFVDISKN
jgi:hypothetical protein